MPVRMVGETESKGLRFHFVHMPQDGAEKPYALLVRALADSGKVGIAEVLIRNRQHLAALWPYRDALVLETTYYADEVREPEVPKLPEPAAEEDGEVVDLVAALRASVERTKTQKQQRRPVREAS